MQYLDISAVFAGAGPFTESDGEPWHMRSITYLMLFPVPVTWVAVKPLQLMPVGIPLGIDPLHDGKVLIGDRHIVCAGIRYARQHGKR